MGWRDRDYARWTDEERRRFYGSIRSGHASRSRATPAALLAVTVSFLVTLALGQLPRSHPLIPALHFTLPAIGTPAETGTNSLPAGTGTISLPTSLRYGSFLTLRGQLPPGETGTVTVEGAYHHAPMRVLATIPARNGAYEARIPVSHRGVLHLRLTYPDGYRSVGEASVR